MPDFKTHLTAGLITGTGIATAGLVSTNLLPIQAGAVIILGTTGSLLPDLDSDTGKPLALLFQLISVLIPVLSYPHFKAFSQVNTPFLLCYFILFYLAINYILCPVIKKMTRHRGMMHSIPFAFLAAEASFLLLYPSGLEFAIYGCISVFSGCMVHLGLDELNSMSLKFGFIVVMKRSSGSALKFIGPDPISTIVTYLLIVLGALAIISRHLPLPDPL